MPDLKKMQLTALSSIDSAITVVENYPDFQRLNTDLSLMNGDNDILDFILDLIKHTDGYDVILNIISSFLYVGLPPLEVAVKSVIIAKLKDYFACSLNPIISDDLIREGMFFSLYDLDKLNMFQISPLDDFLGKYYYYGIEKDEIVCPDDLNKSRDFNAVLWYMKNRSYKRQVWYSSYGHKIKVDTDDKTQKEYISYQREKANKRYPAAKTVKKKNIFGKEKYCLEKLGKDKGVLTLEYSPGTAQLKDIEGKPMYAQTPIGDWIHVFLGNGDVVLGETANKIEDEKLINEWPTKYANYKVKIDELTKEIDKLEKDKTKYEKKLDKLLDKTIDDDTQDGNTLDVKIDELNRKIITTTADLKTKEKEKTSLMKEFRDAENVVLQKKMYMRDTFYQGNATYHELKSNHYYHKTIFQFDIDYILSINLFEPKQVMARLLDEILGLVSFDAQLSIENRILKEELTKMVEMVVRTDDSVVSDCFFTFSNDTYDTMLHQTEMERIGINNGKVTSSYPNNITAEEILSQLNNLDDSSDLQKNIKTLNGALKTITDTVSKIPQGDGSAFSVNFNAKCNFIENLLTNLTVVICESVVSPKLYLLIAMNLKIIGKENNMSLPQFIAMFKQLLVEIIRIIRDKIIDFIFKFIYGQIAKLAKKVGIKLAKERIEDYLRLLQQCLACISLFRMGNNLLDWNIDNVYADIESDEDNGPIIEEC